ncbi:MAG: protein sorting system archaetidylserine decarboxylase [Natrialbaceae archaeon]|nr:protein sorting system archaetidylserine decarboxylase [Natrialbaceae archaeon]
MNLAPGAWRYAAVPLVLAVPLALISPPAALALLGCGLAVLAFFRDPNRSIPARGVLAPADGRVTVLREEGDRLTVGIFMNVWNVHVNRTPVSGSVIETEHHPGAHRPAFSKDSDRNEMVRITLEPDVASDTLEVRLIAGTVARRIHPYVEPGDTLDRGQRIGHIAFGSRVDVRLPPAVDRSSLLVERGDRVVAGESVLFESLP